MMIYSIFEDALTPSCMFFLMLSLANNLHQAMMRSNLCCGWILTCNCCVGNILYICWDKVTNTTPSSTHQYAGTNTLLY